MKQEQMLRLKADAELIEREGRLGVTTRGKTCLARDGLQEAILRLLATGEQAVDALKAALCAQSGSPTESPDISLALAGFILDFTEHIEG